MKKKTDAAASAAPAPATATATAPSPAQAAKPAPAPVAAADSKKESLLCKRGSEVRSLEVETLQPKGCKLWYSRYGNRDSVASSDKANTHCENVQSRIQKNLETVDFTCTAGAISQDNSAAKTTAAAPVAPAKATVPSATPAPAATPVPAKTAAATASPAPSKTTAPAEAQKK